VVSTCCEIAAEPERVFELIADPAAQPRWDGNDNLAWAPAGQRVRRAGDVFTMRLTRGSVLEPAAKATMMAGGCYRGRSVCGRGVVVIWTLQRPACG
jgi:uncharacterized protein YndB with AHSA1/START domain